MTKKTHGFLTAALWASLMAPATLLATGCTWLGLTCTQIGCDDAVSLSVRGLQMDLLYQVDIATPDETVKCTIDMSAATNDDMRMTCNGSNFFYYSPMEGAYIEALGTPNRVVIAVRLNGITIAQEDVKPEYDQLAPNGEACGPICHRAEIAVDL